jgi:hypothetical protein
MDLNSLWNPKSRAQLILCATFGETPPALVTKHSLPLVIIGTVLILNARLTWTWRISSKYGVHQPVALFWMQGKNEESRIWLMDLIRFYNPSKARCYRIPLLSEGGSYHWNMRSDFAIDKYI